MAAMNNPHKNARTTVHSRALMVERWQAGLAVDEIAGQFGVSVRTVRKWIARWRAEGTAGFQNRSSRPGTVTSRLSEAAVAAIEHLRRQYRLSADIIATKLDLARSTVAGWLTRLGLGRLGALEPPEPPRRYQWPRPGDMLHLDIKKLARFNQIGHRITGNRHGRNQGLGYDFFHVAIDDATRLAYVEVLPDERRTSTTAFLIRALRWFRQRGIKVERVMTDNGSGYIAKLFRKALRRLRIKHIRTRPYTPRTNGKAERFIQTLMREWAYATAFPSSLARADDLPRWTHWYNTQRTHYALNRQTPASRLNNLIRNHN
jgi:transposase InsO family protein